MTNACPLLSALGMRQGNKSNTLIPTLSKFRIQKCSHWYFLLKFSWSWQIITEGLVFSGQQTKHLKVPPGCRQEYRAYWEICKKSSRCLQIWVDSHSKCGCFLEKEMLLNHTAALVFQSGSAFPPGVFVQTNSKSVRCLFLQGVSPSRIYTIL